MNLTAAVGAIFGTVLTYHSTSSLKLTAISAVSGAVTTTILSNNNKVEVAGDFSKTLCASVWPIIFKEPDPLPDFYDPEPYVPSFTEDDLEDILINFSLP